MKPLRRASAFYLLYFAALGAVYPFLNLFYQQVGVDTAKIGVLAALLPAVITLAGPLWGAMADFFRLHHWLLPLAMLGTLPSMALLYRSDTYLGLLASIAGYAFFLAPIAPLADHAVITLLADRRHEYGRSRLWGSVGYGVAAWIAGVLLAAFGKGAAFSLSIALMALGALAASRLRPPRRTSIPLPARSLWRTATDRRWVTFLVAAALTGIGFTVLNNYLVLYLKLLGATESLLGFLVGVAALSELPFFLLSSNLMRKWPPRLLLAGSFALLGIRCLLTSLIRDPRWALTVQLLQGPTFSIFWAAGVSYASEIAPPELGASAQSAFGAAQFGLAGTVGALVGGHVYASFGPPALFLLSALVVVVGLSVFTLGGSRSSHVPAA